MNRDKVNQLNRMWSKNNPKTRQAIGQRRKAKQRNLPATFSATDWQHCLEYWNYCCAYCGRPRGLWHKLAQDHFIPVSKGGGYTPDNILPACHGVEGCNNSKCNSDPIEWLTRKFGPRKANQVLKRIKCYFARLDSSGISS